MISAYLTRRGWEVTAASTGQRALGGWRAAGDAIDLVIVDIDMFEESGVRVVDSIRRANPSMPILLMSGSSNLDAMFRGSPSIHWIAKPFGMKAFWDAVSRSLGQ